MTVPRAQAEQGAIRSAATGARNMRLTIALAVVGSALLIGGARQGRTPARVPTGWIAVESPGRQADGYVCAFWDDTTWRVALTRDSTALQIVRDSTKPDVQTFDVPGGQLLGYDGGEFGGEVLYRANDGRVTHLAKQNLSFFVPSLSGILGLGGIAHLGFNRGWLFRFTLQVNGPWTAESLMSLDGDPLAYTALADDTLLVVALGAIVLVRPPSYKTVLFRDTLIALPNAHSVVRDRAGVIYVGMRYAVTRLKPRDHGYTDDWIVPASCPRRVRTAETGKCACAPDLHGR